MEELLPIGSVIELNDHSRRMIVGYLPSKLKDDVLYDYVCCENRVGIRKRWDKIEVNRDIFYVQKKDILKVLYIGYENVEFDSYVKCHSMIEEKLKTSNIKDMGEEEIQKMYTDIFDKIKKDGSDKNEINDKE